MSDNSEGYYQKVQLKDIIPHRLYFIVGDAFDGSGNKIRTMSSNGTKKHSIVNPISSITENKVICLNGRRFLKKDIEIYKLPYENY